MKKLKKMALDFENYISDYFTILQTKNQIKRKHWIKANFIN